MPLQLPAYLTQLTDRIRREAIDLRPQHVADVGFHVQPALDAVGELETHGVAVLGADTWTVRDGEQPRVFPSLGWAVADLAAQEEWQDYVRRAAAAARERIKGADLYARDGGWGTLIFAGRRPTLCLFGLRGTAVYQTHHSPLQNLGERLL